MEMFDAVISMSASNYDAKDKVRMTISHASLPEEIFIHLRDVSKMNGAVVMERFEKVLNSHKDMSVDESFEISMGLMKLHKGGGVGNGKPKKRVGPSLLRDQLSSRMKASNRHNVESATSSPAEAVSKAVSGAETAASSSPQPSGTPFVRSTSPQPSGPVRRTHGLPKKGGKSLPLFPHLNSTVYSSIVNKKAIVEIVSEEGEFVCAAKSIVVCMAKLNRMRRNDFHNLIRKTRQSSSGYHSLKSRALRLQAEADLPSDSPLTIAELANFESILNVKIGVIQFVDDSSEPVVSEVSGEHFEETFFLYYVDSHFHAVVNPHAMFPKSKLCMDCFAVYGVKEKTHPCPSALKMSCFVCKRKECAYGETVICPACNMTCRNMACFESHKQPFSSSESLCDKRRKCNDCGKIVFLKEQNFSDHICGHYKCIYCSEFVSTDHLCYLRRKKIKLT